MSRNEYSRDIASARTLLQALADMYAEALDSNRLPAWEKAGHSIIDLLAAKEAERPASPEGTNP